jgi:indole-3-glycerol phosphate synthase
VLGASAVLLICSILSEQQLAEYHAMAMSLGLSVLVEMHDEAEVETALRIGAKILGVNNRNLKDFTVDPYMIYEAKVLGASAVLLICSILTEEDLREYLYLCDELGLSVLVEAHDETEVRVAAEAGARIIGVNNRNLKDFSVDTDNSRRLREQIPHDVLFVSESGVKSAEDVAKLRQIGADAVLIGETLMRATDKKAKLDELRGDV